MSFSESEINAERHRFPHCLVWTPIPLITWFFPFIGHMGIGLTSGIIRDFAGSYFVSEDNMAFGWPLRYLQLDLNNCPGGASAWDRGIIEASEEYSQRTHNLFCDNCHSHVAMALDKMNYDGRSLSFRNMITLSFLLLRDFEALVTFLYRRRNDFTIDFRRFSQSIWHFLHATSFPPTSTDGKANLDTVEALINLSNVTLIVFLHRPLH
uniref:Transmembrane protein 222 n=1 Tax=Romanomermis culicivorax TaxID=13658 RepID=A0A915L153_ROMCU